MWNNLHNEVVWTFMKFNLHLSFWVLFVNSFIHKNEEIFCMFHVLKRIRNLRHLTSSQADVAFFCWIQKITAERFGAFVRKYYFCTRNTGCSSVRLEYASGGRVVAGSNPVIPTSFFSLSCCKYSAWKRFCFLSFPFFQRTCVSSILSDFIEN